jgi:hypothetical protein
MANTTGIAKDRLDAVLLHNVVPDLGASLADIVVVGQIMDVPVPRLIILQILRGPTGA